MLRPWDPEQIASAGHEALYGSPAQNDPEHERSRACAMPRLFALLPALDLKDRTVEIEGEPQSREKHVNVTLAFTEISQTCLDEKAKQDPESVTGGLVNELTDLPGLRRIGPPMWYETGGQKVHVTAVQGRPVLAGKSAEDSVMVMALSTVWQGHLLFWSISANDQEIFNQVSRLMVQFGDGPVVRLFPMKIGTAAAGKPIDVLPK